MTIRHTHTTTRARWLTTLGAAGLAAALTLPAAVGASGEHAPLPVDTCSSTGNDYELGCRALPGHADGWFGPSVSAAPPSPVAATPVRIDQRYQ